MRLICPNCGAQYEVADDVIPPNGRDVQCSNCGHTWFEEPGASEAAERNDSDQTAPPEQTTETQPEPEPEAPEVAEPQEEEDAPEPETDPEPAAEEEPEPELESEPEPDAEPAAELEPESEPDEESEPEAHHADDTQDVAAPRQPRELDPSVADILREEAEFEQAARQAEAAPIETQPDLGLNDDPEQDRRSREAQDRLARLRGEPDATAAIAGMMAQDADAPRRELLPDIEEINSTLRRDPTEGSADYEAEPVAAQRSAFRRGFVYIIALALIAMALYIFAPQISAAVPAVEPALTGYVAWVDGLRVWLDGQVQGFVAEGGDAASDTPADPVIEDAPEG